MDDLARISAKVRHARKVETALQWMGWSVVVLGVLAVAVFAVLWASGDLDAEQALSLIFGAAFATILSGATAYGSGVNVGLSAERLELAAPSATSEEPGQG